MPLDPLRVGAVRGPQGTTLDDLLAALGNLYAKEEAIRDLLSQANVTLLNLRGALGSLDDCSNRSLVALVCSLESEIVGAAPPGGPPASCPGFETGFTFFTSAIEQGTLDGLPSGNYFQSFAAAPPEFQFSSFDAAWDSASASNVVTFFSWDGPEGETLAVCIGVYGVADGLNVVVQRLVEPNNHLANVTTITAANDPSFANATVVLTAGVKYIIGYVMNVPETPPAQPRAWITRN